MCIWKDEEKSMEDKGFNNLKSIHKVDQNFPGAKVSTDQTVVTQPGLVPQLSGRHTSGRICGATRFFDHHSKYSYSTLQTSLDGDQTLGAKYLFESHADAVGVKMKSYRADNGRFAEKSLVDAIKIIRQKIDFCAIGAHHQNGMIQRLEREHMPGEIFDILQEVSIGLAVKPFSLQVEWCKSITISGSLSANRL